MKKLFILVFIGACFLFSFCDEQTYTVLIENTSSKTVSYLYDGDSNTLLTGENKVYYKVKSYTQPPKDITVLGAMSVKMTRAGDVITFTDAEKIDLSVTNLLSSKVTLKAGEYIDAGGGETEMEIPAGGTDESAKIYTATPKFTTFPPGCTVEWKLDGNTITVTIK